MVGSERPKVAAILDEIGHWEMDTVVGEKGTNYLNGIKRKHNSQGIGF